MDYLNKLYMNISDLKIDLGSGINPKKNFIGLDNFVGIKAQSIQPESLDRSKLNVIQHDLNSGIPFEDESVDAVFTSHFLEHCSNLDLIFEETHRVLKKTKKFEIIVPYANSAEGMFPGHGIFFTEKWFMQNIIFNKFFKIEKIYFYETEDYHKNKQKINRIFNFTEARTFLYNACNQMHIIAKKKDSESSVKLIKKDIEFVTVPFSNQNENINKIKKKIIRWKKK